MHVSIQRIDRTLPLPEYHTAGAAAFDLTARETITIVPGEIVLIPANLIGKMSRA
jgi:dUTPase